MNNEELFIQTLKRYFGYDSFRSIQLDIIRSIYEGYDTLGLMPTGGGKSITFQVPALLMNGVCIVVTPLIALMKDQVMHLRERGIKAECIHAGLTHDEIQRILDNAIYDAVKFLYVSPERLQSTLFRSKLNYMKVCFITIDEAHCISQWGYDFRPSYLRIAEIRKQLPDIPILALTATATPHVVTDIQEQLSFGTYKDGASHFYRASFKRDNLSYVVRKTDDKIHEITHILQSVAGSTIIYTRSRKRTKEISDILNEQEIPSTFYHAGLDFAIKDTRQAEWTNGKYRVMVATNAFGMGIDKPDVRLVIHYDCPDSIEAYFQEAGRAGRDGRRSYAVLLYNGDDRVKLMRHSNDSFPPKEYVRNVYDDLAYYLQIAEYSGEGARFEFNEELFCIRFKHHPARMIPALHILQNAGYITYDPEPDSQPRVMFTVLRNDLDHISNISQKEEQVITSLLRYYGSLFSEFTFINPALIAKAAGITESSLHQILKSIAQRHIITYVPKRNVPIITYTQQRICSDRLIIPRNIYEDLQRHMLERINAVLRYTETDNVCRSQMLLEYFGETNSEPCYHCDICQQNRKKETTCSNHNNKKNIAQLLADGKQHHIDELKQLHLAAAEFEKEIEQLREQEIISINPPYIQILHS